MSNLPEYTQKAISKYKAKKDLVSLVLKQGTKEKIKSVYGDISYNSYFQSLVDRDLDEKTKTKKPAPASVNLDDPANVFENYKN